MCDFLLAFYSRLTSYFRTVSQLSSRICWKSWIFYSHLYLKSFTRTSRKVLTQYLTSLTGQNRLCFDKLHERDRQTDRQTDRIAKALLYFSYTLCYSVILMAVPQSSTAYTPKVRRQHQAFIATITSNCDSFFPCKASFSSGTVTARSLIHWLRR